MADVGTFDPHWDYARRIEEQASFEPRAVLAPRRARLTRLALLLPAVALVATAWAGLSGARSDQATAETPDPNAVAAQSFTVEGSIRATPGPRSPQRPAQVIGLDVQQLDDVVLQRLGRDDVIAVTGWYIATAITDCPRVAVIRREGSLPEVRRDFDELAFCDRFGLLFASRPLSDGSRDAGLPSVVVTLVVGVVVPDELEMIGAGTQPRWSSSDGSSSQATGAKSRLAAATSWLSITWLGHRASDARQNGRCRSVVRHRPRMPPPWSAIAGDIAPHRLRLTASPRCPLRTSSVIFANVRYSPVAPSMFG